MISSVSDVHRQKAPGRSSTQSKSPTENPNRKSLVSISFSQRLLSSCVERTARQERRKKRLKSRKSFLEEDRFSQKNKAESIAFLAQKPEEERPDRNFSQLIRKTCARKPWPKSRTGSCKTTGGRPPAIPSKNGRWKQNLPAKKVAEKKSS